jgi:hypothetical protein
MTLREYFRSFFTREYWEALGGFLFGAGFADRQIREDFWERHDEEMRRDDE